MVLITEYTLHHDHFNKEKLQTLNTKLTYL